MATSPSCSLRGAHDCSHGHGSEACREVRAGLRAAAGLRPPGTAMLLQSNGPALGGIQGADHLQLDSPPEAAQSAGQHKFPGSSPPVTCFRIRQEPGWGLMESPTLTDVIRIRCLLLIRPDWEIPQGGVSVQRISGPSDSSVARMSTCQAHMEGFQDVVVTVTVTAPGQAAPREETCLGQTLSSRGHVEGSWVHEDCGIPLEMDCEETWERQPPTGCGALAVFLLASSVLSGFAVLSLQGLGSGW
ncbi:hypothetical protein CB1_000186003 [Camelus ferus]|nr:hypothetical protein CB1_000186003 [Camelus ferus]